MPTWPRPHKLLRLLGWTDGAPVRAAHARVRMQLEEIEPRILHSADLLPGLAEALVQHVEIRVVETPQAEAPGAAQDARMTRELFIIDAATPEYEVFVADIVAQRAAGRALELVIVDSGSDGIAAVSDALAGRSGIEAIHILSHGGSGQIGLGGSVIDRSTLDSRGNEIARWSLALTEQADILVYGCDVAATSDGRALVEALANLTGADVTASDDITGHESLGGDWTLEYRAGAIDSASALSAGAQAAWLATLPSYDAYLVNHDAAFSSLADTGYELKSTASWGQTFSYDSPGATYSVDKVALVLSRAAAAPAGQTLTISIRSSWTGAAIASATLSSDSLSTTEQWHTLTLSAPATLNDLSTYYLRVTSNGSGQVYLGAADVNGYAGGELVNDAGASIAAKDMAFRLIASGSQTAAPVLSGANNLTGIRENETTNGGTLVSALIAGHFSDTDPNTPGGIAVVGVVNAQGLWQYSRDGAATWSNFGSPSNSAARLLQADANTYVRFVPNGTWSGTVTDGLKFRAWDGSKGSAGSIDDIGVKASDVIDKFTSVSYSNQDGATNWSSSWVDADNNPTAGSVYVSGGYLTLATFAGSEAITRQVNLVTAVSASISVSFDNTLGAGGTVLLQVSGNGGSTFATVGTFSNVANPGIASYNVDITPYMAVDTQVRFLMNGSAGGGSFRVDKIDVLYDVPDVGGSFPYSSSVGASAITVSAQNDAPQGANAAVTVLEDTAIAFTAEHFGFTDAGDTPPNDLVAVKITTLPTAGSLRLSGTAVTAGQLVSAVDIAGGKLVYTPGADGAGAGYASFTFQVQDDGGTANSGVDLDPTPRTMTIDVSAVNDAPLVTAPAAAVTAISTPLVFSSANGNAISVSDVDAASAAVRVSLTATNGALTLSGTAGLTFTVGTGSANATMTFSGTLASVNAALNGLRYDPTAAWTGAAQLTVLTDDLGNTGSGGALDTTSVVAITVGTNTAPTLAGAATLNGINEDPAANPGTPVSTLIAGQVGDPDTGALSGIAVTAVVNTNGTWQYSLDGTNWVAFGTPTAAAARLLTADDFVRFVPNADWNGTVVNGITFRAWDQTAGAPGATADTSSGGFSVRDDFAAVSYANQDGTASWAGNWVDSDGAGAGGGQIQVSGGALVMNAGIVSSNTIYRQANLSAATDVTFSFSYNNSLAGLASVSVSVSGDGGSSWTTLASGFAGGTGTASYGISGEAAANTRIRFGVSGVVGGGSFSVDDVQIAYTQPLNGGTTAFSAALESSAITVSAVNDAPAGTSATVTTREDTPHVFTVANFGFSDPVEGHGLLAVKIATLPAAGALTLNGSAVTAGQFVSAADITAGLLAFAPAANAVGAGYATFGFQVQDNGGTAGGGVDLDPVSRTMTVDVTAVNDAPTGTSSTVTTGEDVAYVFAASNFGFNDATDGHGLMAVRIASLPAAGALTLNGAAILVGDFVSAADILAGRLVFTPGANAVGAGHASFTFQVQDNGGTANGGIDLDTTARTLTIDVTAVNDAPSGTSATVTTVEDTALTFTAAHFGFTDSADTPANALAAVRISSVPVAGTLRLSGVAVTAGQFVSAADITAGVLVYTPAVSGNGAAYASFTFQVRDDGGTANDGIDLDPTARTMTIDVTAINDAPSSTVPVTQTTSVSTPLVFSSANGNAISVSDVDASTSQVQVALTVTNGTLTLSGTTGLTFSVGNGSANTSMTFTGTLANVNAGLNGLRYIPTTLYVGTAQLSITTSDLGNTGTGGALTAVDYVAISVGEQAMVDQIQSSYEAPFVDLSDYELKSGQSWGQTFVYDSPGATYAVDKVALVLSRSVDATAGQTLTVSLRPSWGGAALATATLSSDALGTSESWITLALNTQVSLNDNQTYYLRVDSNGSGKVWLGVHNSGSYASGDLINHPGVAQGGKDAAFRIIDNRPTTAPVLSGGNAVTGIAEDPGSNPGTAVSVLIAGRVTDGDTGALSGIAVTATDNTNGTWQYSLDGTSWSSFGTPSVASARLLASDDWVRFVPNANWHGTVASGLTFRAWDQTTGTAGTAADTTTVSLAVRDNFGLATYSGNDGTASWSSSWLETGDNASPASGQIRVTGGRLRFDGGLSTTSTIERQLNLANATSATLTFDFDNSIGTGTIRLFASSNGGTSWTQLAGSFAGGTGSASYNLTGYASPDTRVRFQVVGEPGVLGLILQGGMFYADNVQISYVMPLNGGNTAFSVASASSGLTVASANDAPVGVSNTVTTVEDTPFTFTAAHFGFSDPVDVPANAFAGVRVVTLPGAGTLRLNGVAVSAGVSVTAADIAANRLVYTPGADGNGTGYASFTFQVRDDGGTANGGADYDLTARTITIDVTAVNDAPVLAGAGNLATIDEDAVSNGGTSIAALLGAFATDPDAGALRGIAVSAVDNTNGTWQYSTNSGGTWTNFSALSANATRLLADDGATFVRFVPNANWNGTVANGITFRAWDRTVGTNGGTASTIPNPVYLDSFNAVSYSNNDGTGSWAGGWTETEDGSAASGKINIGGGLLELRSNAAGTEISRQVNLTGATAATLSFSYNNALPAGALIRLEASANSGASYTTIATFSDVARAGVGAFSTDLTGYISETTRVRFAIVSNGTPVRSLDIDDFRIAAVAAGAGGASAFSSATASSGITVTAVNDAPVLTGANALGGINEDETTNPGTRVADLIAGRSSDVDAGAVVGIAVTAADVTNGSWQYSLDSGASWNALGPVADTNARLLAADAGTFVRFVPNANWNGTLENALTFRAWDGTAGANGGLRTTVALASVADNFSSESYANSDGTMPWAGNWVETNDNGGASSGDIHITSGDLLHIHPNESGATFYRPVDLSAAVSAALSFAYSNSVGGSGAIQLQLSANGGASYTTLAVFSNAANAGSGVYSADVSAFASAATRLRFVVAATGGGKLDIDTVAFSISAAGNGGTSAFSTATASASIAVAAVNDAPTGASNTVVAVEDTTGVFTRGTFGYSDAGDSPVNAFAAVRIVTLPGAGALTVDGVAVTAGQTIAIADIDAGKLAFRAAADANGTGYTSFTFRVQDDGGTANGGSDLDLVARTMTINVTAVNDAPVLAGANALGTINEDPSSNPGTLVSALIAGFFSDADAGTQSGIAVTAVDSANGTWQYSLNGSTWSNFGSPSAGNARLLWADADNRVRFVPNANWNGTAGITFRAWDRATGSSGNTADTTASGGSTAYSVATATATLTVNAVNDAPAGANRTTVTNEDTPYVLAVADFGYSDSIDGHALAAVKIAALPAAGTLKLSNVALTAGQFVSAADIAAGNLVYTPAAHASGTGYASFTFQVQDAGGTANGGIDLDATPNTIAIDVTAVNDAPMGTSATATLLEDATRVFTAADFGYADAVEGHALVAVKISTVPAAGALTLNGSTVAAGQFVSAADIAAGRLAYVPAADSSGAGYASFTFQVQDDGGTANAGIDLDLVARTITLDVTAVNDAPSGADATLTLAEDTTVVLTAAHFGYTDAADGDALRAVNIVSAPGAGVLRLSGVTVADGQAISAADIAAGNLLYTPAANAHGAAHASFTFQVQDAGGKANGGLDLDPVARTLTFDVTSINDAPSASDVSVGTPENVALVFDIANFGLVDDADRPGNALAAVRIATTPATGALTLNGVAVTPGRWVSAADISSGLLVYTPVAGTSGLAYASFGFQVRDDGGTASGGIDTDPTTRTLTIDVGAINHGPVGTSTTLTLLEDGAHVFAAADFGYTDPNDPVAHAFTAVKITTLPAAGTLTLTGAAVSAGQFVSIADLAAGRLVYSPAAHASGTGYASFAFQVQDDGGTANGGSDLDRTARTMTLNVTAVNDAPSGADRTLTLWEDQSYAFGLADFGFSDALDTPANGLIAVRLMSLPSAGALTLNGAAVSAGQSISAADVATGRLVFTAPADGNGARYASFTFRVQDGGGTANGGVDLDPTARTLTLNVTAINDAPSIAGANALDAIAEDQASNPGTRVSALIAGQVFDADATTVFGIAVVGVDDTNGTWQYSMNSGASWTAFGVSSAGSARLLAADANTFVRFVPNPDFHGAVTNGLTFRAWDGSVGWAGGLADATRGTTAVRDDFSSASYAGNAGASIWLGPWTDPDRNPGMGAVQVVAGALRIATFNGTTWVYRDVDLAAATGAQLSFAYNNTLGAAGSVFLQVSANGGTSYDTLDSFSETSNGGVGVYSLDLGSYLSSDTRLRFVMQGDASGGTFLVDNVEIQYDAPLVGGAGAFSDAVVTTGITVLPVNDAPTGADRTRVILEDTAHVFSAADFGYADVGEGHAFSGVRIAGVPSAGTLTLNGAAVAAGEVVSAVDIAAGRLVYAAAPNAHGAAYSSFTFQVQDDGGTAYGGTNMDTVARRYDFDVTSVDDAPQGVNARVTTLEDTAIAFSSSVFGFSDPADTPGGALLAVKISALPAEGTLRLAGAVVTAGEFISAAAIDAGQLSFTPASGASGTSYATFLFQVQDDGAGQAVDPIARVMTIDVTAVRREIVIPVSEPVVTVPVVAPPPAETRVGSTATVAASGSASSSVPGGSTGSSSTTSAAGSQSGEKATESADGEGSGGTGESEGDARARGAEDLPAQAAAGDSRQAAGVTSAAVGATVQRADSVQVLKADVRDAGIVQATESQSIAAPPSDGSGGISISFAAQLQSSSAAALATPEARALGRELDQLRDSMRDQTRLEAATVAATAATGMSLSVGYVVWLLRGGALLSTFLSSLPAWRFIDPLPVLGRIDDDDDGDEADDSLESMVASGEASADGLDQGDAGRVADAPGVADAFEDVTNTIDVATAGAGAASPKTDEGRAS